MSTLSTYLQMRDRSENLDIASLQDTVIDVEDPDTPLLENPSFFSQCINCCGLRSVSSLCSRVRSSFSNITAEKIKKIIWDNKGEIALGIAVNGVAYYVSSATDLEPENIKWQIYSLYGSLFAAHAFQLARCASKGQKLRSLIHTTSAGLATTYPVLMEMNKLHLGWHHMSIGLSCLVPGYKALGLFGAALVGDEIFYYDELHIYPNNHTQKAIQDFVGNEGLDDRLVQYFQPIVITLTAITILEIGIKQYRRHRSNQSGEDEELLITEETDGHSQEIELTQV